MDGGLDERAHGRADRRGDLACPLAAPALGVLRLHPGAGCRKPRHLARHALVPRRGSDHAVEFALEAFHHRGTRGGSFVPGVFVLGHLGDTAHPDVRGAIDAAIGRIVQTGKVAGILAPVEADARRWLELGCRFVAVGSDVGILARQSEALAAKFKP